MKLIDTMQDCLAALDLRFFRASDSDAIVLTFCDGGQRTGVHITADEENRYLAVRADGGVFVPAARRDAASLYLTYANWSLRVGGFQMSLQSGEVVYHSGLCAPTDVRPELLDPLVFLASSTYARYHTGLMAVAYQGADPAGAVAEVEGRASPAVSRDAVDAAFDRLVGPSEEPSLGGDVPGADRRASD